MPKSCITNTSSNSLIDDIEETELVNKLNSKQLTFIKDKDNIKFMNNMRKIMSKYDMDLKQIEDIIVLHLETERNIAEKK